MEETGCAVRMGWASLILLLGVSCMERPEVAHFGAPVPESTGRVVTVRGEGFVAGEPNMADLTLRFSTWADRADIAYRDNQAKVHKLTQGLLNMDINPVDVTPRGSELSGSPTNLAIQRVGVKVRDLNQLTKIITACLNMEATLDGVRFFIANTGPMEERCRANAVIDARARAQVLAQEMGMKLGEPVSITELSSYTDSSDFEVWATVEVIFRLETY